MNIPENLLYTKSHEWARREGDEMVIGLTDFAQKELGDLVFINLPLCDDDATLGEPIADVESVKAVSDVYSPVSGVVAAVNEELIDHPENINAAPYEAWIARVKDITEEYEWLDAAAYAELTVKEG